MDYDVIIVGAGPGGIFTAYELAKADRALKIGVFELGKPLDKRRCPIDGKKVKSCVKCPNLRDHERLRRRGRVLRW